MPINRRSVIMLSNTGSAMNQYSDPVEGDSYYGYTDGLHTIQVIYNQYVGRFRVQGTLMLEPAEEDWFELIPETTTGTAWNPIGYVQFTEAAPALLSEAYTFRGNYTFLRVYMDRAYIADGVTYSPSYGQISKVILSA